MYTQSPLNFWESLEHEWDQIYQIEQPLTHEIKDYLNHFQKSVSGVEEENTAINFSFLEVASL